MSSTNLDAKIDINDFQKLAREDISKLIKGAAVGSALIFNASGKPVTFYVYNYIDVVYWISAQKTKVAHGYHGTVTASGKVFKIHPNKEKGDEFTVVPNGAYIYRGPGKLEHINKK